MWISRKAYWETINVLRAELAETRNKLAREGRELSRVERERDHYCEVAQFALNTLPDGCLNRKESNALRAENDRLKAENALAEKEVADLRAKLDREQKDARDTVKQWWEDREELATVKAENERIKAENGELREFRALVANQPFIESYTDMAKAVIRIAGLAQGESVRISVCNTD